MTDLKVEACPRSRPHPAHKYMFARKAHQCPGVTDPKQYRVWHIPQVPGKPFYVDVESIEQGRKIQDLLADYDQFQLDNKIKPDYANMNGLEEYDDVLLVWSEVDEEEY